MKRISGLLFALALALSSQAQTYKYLQFQNATSVDTGSYKAGRIFYNPTVGKFSFMEGGVTKHLGSTAFPAGALKADGSIPLTADWNVGGFKLTNLADPISAQDAATKAYVDAVAQGLATKPSAHLATTDTLPANTYNNGTLGVGATLTANHNGNLTIDGDGSLIVGQRILVKDEANKTHNGIYVVTTVGTVSVPYVLTRATDNDQAADFPSAFVFVQNGSLNPSSGWVVIGSSFTVGTTAIEWTQFNNNIIAGIGLTAAGNTFNVNTSQNITTLSNLTTKGLVTTTAAGLLGSQHGTGFIKDDGAGNITYASAVTTETDPVASAINGILYSNGATLAAATGSNLNSTFGSQTATYVYAAPNGGAGTPSFRALLLSDLPNLSSLYAPLSRSLTINGSAQDLSADRTWTITTTGTSNRISVSGGTGLTPTIDISASYVGQSSITTLGTIGGGTWQANKIALAYGGTNADLSATGGTSQVLKQSTLGGNITVGQLSYSDISGTPTAAYLLASGGTATAANTFTFNTANWFNETSTFTATANNQFATNWTGVETSTATASDVIYGDYFNRTIVAGSTSIVAQPINISPVFKTNSGITTGTGGLQNGTNVYQSRTVAGMTPGTYTLVSAASTSGSGTGAVFTVIVATATTFTSFNCTTSGNGYNAGIETVTFNGSQFGAGGSGSITLGIISTTNSFGTGSSALVIQLPRVGYTNAANERWIDFKSYDGTTSYGSIDVQNVGSSGTNQYNIVFNDPSGSMFSSNGGTLSINRNLAVNNSGTNTYTVGNTTFTINNNAPSQTIGSFRVEGSSGGFTAANVFQSKIRVSGSVSASFGFVNAANLTTGGSGYTTGVKSTSGSATGSGCTINILSVSAGAILTFSISAVGGNYVVGDVLNVSGGSSGTITITAVDFAGHVSAFEDISSYTDSKSNNIYSSLLSRPTYNMTTTQTTAWTGVLNYDPTYTNIGSAVKGGIAIVPAGTLNIIGGAATSASATWDVRGSGSNPTLKLVGAGTGTNYTARFFQSDGTTETFSLKDNGATAFLGTVSSPNHIDLFSTTATAAGTTTLTTTSNYYQAFTGSTTQTVALPVVTTMINGQGFLFTNTSSGVVTIQTSGGNTIKAMAANSQLTVWVINTGGGTGTASWNWQYTASLNN